MNKVRVCIVGCGWTGTNHFAGYSQIPQKAEVIAVVARTKESRTKAKSWGIKYLYDSFEDALKDSDINAFDLCTPPYLHAEQAIRAIRSGRHLIVETPACITQEECRELRMAIRDYPELKSVTGHVCRSWPTYKHAKKLVESGAVGDIFYLSSNYAHQPDPNEYPSSKTWARNILYTGRLSISYHSVDLLRWMSGDVDEVYADFTDHAKIAILRFKNGALGKVFTSGSVIRPYIMSLSTYGHKGTIICWWEENTLKGHLHTSSSWQPTALETTPAHGRGSPEWRYEMENFVDSILEDKEPNCPLIEGVATVETCLAVDQAMTTGAKVRVRQ